MDETKTLVQKIMEIIGDEELTEEEIEDIIFDYKYGDWFI